MACNSNIDNGRAHKRLRVCLLNLFWSLLSGRTINHLRMFMYWTYVHTMYRWFRTGFDEISTQYRDIHSGMFNVLAAQHYANNFVDFVSHLKLICKSLFPFDYNIITNTPNDLLNISPLLSQSNRKSLSIWNLTGDLLVNWVKIQLKAQNWIFFW